ncbi:hypothetical protein Ancab_028843, partial [Ancistrocladus abbreviatus]
ASWARKLKTPVDYHTGSSLMLNPFSPHTIRSTIRPPSSSEYFPDCKTMSITLAPNCARKGNWNYSFDPANNQLATNFTLLNHQSREPSDDQTFSFRYDKNRID